MKKPIYWLWLALLMLFSHKTDAYSICSSSIIESEFYGGEHVNPSNVSIQLVNTGGPLTVPVRVDLSTFPFEPLDVYFLWDSSYTARYFSSHFYKTSTHRLLGIMNAIKAHSPNAWFGLGFFTVKRLVDIGNANDYVFHNVVNMTGTPIVVDNAFNAHNWSALKPVSDITSGLEAFMQVMLRSDTSLGFRHGSRRVVIWATDVMYGQEGDVSPRILSPLTEYNPSSPFPVPNNLDAVMESNCRMTGLVCLDTCSPTMYQPRTLIPSVYCKCGMLPYNNLQMGTIDYHNVTQFDEGSCEDFPDQVDVVNIAQLAGFDLFAVVPIDTLQTHLENTFLTLTSQISANSHVFTAYDLNILLPPLLPGVPLSPYVNTTMIDFLSWTYGNCNATACTFNFTFDWQPSGGGDFVITINGAVFLNVHVDECVTPSNSESNSHSTSHHSKSRSHSHTHTPTRSPTPTESPRDTESLTASTTESTTISTTASTTASATFSESESESESRSESESQSQSQSESQSSSQSEEEEGSEEEQSSTPSVAIQQPKDIWPVLIGVIVMAALITCGFCLFLCGVGRVRREEEKKRTTRGGIQYESVYNPMTQTF